MNTCRKHMHLDTFSAKPPDSSSLEIRWFFSKPVPELNTFIREGFPSKPVSETRTDLYYPIPGREDLSLKIREGKRELKKRRLQGTPLHFNGSQAGYLEIWDKWVLPTELEERRYPVPISLRKQRWALKIAPSDTGAWTARPYATYLTQGIQVEYTALSWRDRAYFTFGLDGFGDIGQAALLNFLALLPPCPELTLDQSSGYPYWIARL
jgi:hypothetical protein